MSYLSHETINCPFHLKFHMWQIIKLHALEISTKLLIYHAKHFSKHNKAKNHNFSVCICFYLRVSYYLCYNGTWVGMIYWTHKARVDNIADICKILPEWDPRHCTVHNYLIIAIQDSLANCPRHILLRFISPLHLLSASCWERNTLKVSLEWFIVSSRLAPCLFTACWRNFLSSGKLYGACIIYG